VVFRSGSHGRLLRSHSNNLGASRSGRKFEIELFVDRAREFDAVRLGLSECVKPKGNRRCRTT
jgi:hypothetical protein